jgi:hypothetical protein
MLMLSGRGPLTLTLILAVVTVPSVHEDMQQGAGKQDQEREESEEVCPVLGEKEKARDGQKREQHPLGPGLEPAAAVRTVLMFHQSSAKVAMRSAGSTYRLARAEPERSLPFGPQGGLRPVSKRLAELRVPRTSPATPASVHNANDVRYTQVNC